MYYTCISNGKNGWSQRWTHYTQIEAEIHRNELITDYNFDEKTVYIEQIN